MESQLYLSMKHHLVFSITNESPVLATESLCTNCLNVSYEFKWVHESEFMKLQQSTYISTTTVLQYPCLFYPKALVPPSGTWV